MTRRGVVLCVLIGALLWSGAPSIAQEQPPAQPGGGGAVGLLSTAYMRVGTQAVGACGEPGYFAPYGNGLGLLEPGKQLYWRLEAQFQEKILPQFAPPFSPVNPPVGRVDLCGSAAVPSEQVPEIGTAGACDSLTVTGGRGRFEPAPLLSESVAHEVDDVSSTPTGSVVVITGRLPGAEGEQPGSLRMLLQRRTHGMCAHKNHEATRVSATYPQGGTSAELVGVIAYVLPRASVANTTCEDEWGQVRRHLRGAGAGIECPVPPEI